MRASIRGFVLIASLAMIAVATISLATIQLAYAGVIDKARAAEHASPAGTWLAWGGQTRFHFNPDELERLGVTFVRTDGVSSRVEGQAGVRYEVDAFPALDARGRSLHSGRIFWRSQPARRAGSLRLLA